MNKIHTRILASIQRSATMEKAINYLRELDFRFYEGFLLFHPECLKEVKYSWMIRFVDKKNWDKTLIFGIKMWGKKNCKIIVRYEGKLFMVIRKDWKDMADINFRKITVKLKFPDYLDYEERRKWRTEYHKQLRNPTRKPTDWYQQHLPNIQFL